MKRFIQSALLATALVIPVHATADETSFAGTAITSRTLVAHAEMVRIADALDAAVDAKDWELARSFFTDTINVDFTSLTGGEPATIPADGLITGWSSNLTAEKTADGWRINAMTFTAKAERGSTFVRNTAGN